MSLIFLAGSGVLALDLKEQECKPSHFAKKNLFAERYLLNIGPVFLAMKMFAHLQQIDWLETESALMSFAAGSHAKTSASQVKEQDLPGNDLDCGMNSTVSSRKFSRITRSLKTSQPFDLEDWTRYSGAYLRSGMTRNGIVFPLQPLARLTAATASGLPLIATPTTKGNQLAPSMMKHSGCRLLSKVIGQTESGLVPPRIFEWMMGYPARWTELEPSEMPSSHKSQK